jgi:hypothetical protein
MPVVIIVIVAMAEGILVVIIERFPRWVPQLVESAENGAFA